ncbi:MAG: hypothetical protein H0U62_05000 [Actinobacteria bacterium]|nr:hypothetical protein [Actinomycetota bacterium]
MSDRLVSRMELCRLPFQRRPVAEPGTTLVFHMANGQLVEPSYPYTTGETWWRGPKAAYVVDVTPHAAQFECQLPSSAGAVYFSATVSYSWNVHDAARVVREQVADPAAECRAHLSRWLPTVTSRFSPDRPAEAGTCIRVELGRASIDLERGIRIQDLDAQLRMDPDQALLAKEWEIGKLRQEIAKRDAGGKGEVAAIEQRTELHLQSEREQHYSTAVTGGRERVMAVVMAQDPAKAPEILNTMIGLSEREEQRTLEAIKVLIDGGEIRLGELDGAVQAAVERISGILGKPVAQVGSGPATDQEKVLPSASGTGEEGGS